MPDEFAFLSIDGPVAREVRALDWSLTPIGAPSGWPDALRMTLATMLSSSQPMFLAWGPDLVSLFNDAYRPALGARGDGALGRRFPDLWSDVWADIGPIVERALAGEASSFEDFPLTMTRNGVPEETWWTFTYSPLRDAGGAVRGVLCVTTETSGRHLAERAARAERERLAVMFESAPGFMALLEGPDHRFASANAAFLRLVGGRQVVGRTVAEALPEVVEQGFVRLLDQVRRSGQAFSTRGAQVALAAGPGGRAEERRVDFVYQPVAGAGGQVTAVFVEGHDVTEAHEAQDTLRESEGRFRALFDSLDEAVVIMEQRPPGPDGRHDYAYVMLNRAARAMFGLHGVDGSTTRASRPQAEEEWYEAFDRAIATGETIRFERRSEGAGRTYEVYLSRIGEAPSHTLLTVTRDVSARRRAEDALRDLNDALERRVADRTAELRLLARIVETTDAFVQVVDLDHRVLAANPAAAAEFARLYGVPLRVGSDLLALLADRPAHQAQVRALWARALAGEEYAIVEEFGDPAHARGTYEFRFNALRDGEGRVVGAFQIVTDVTERVAAEARLAETEAQLRQAQKMEALGGLTGGVAHDFNNLLTPIVGGLDILQRRGVGGPRERRLIEGALQSADRARVLVSRLLSFARRQPLTTGAVDLGALVEGMRDLVGTTLGLGVALDLAVEPDLPPARADANQLEMAILNLAVNARDAMPGGGRLRIAARRARADGAGEAGGAGETGEAAGATRSPPRSLPPGDYLCLSVADTGTGMDAATLARATEPFFSTKGVGRGTGLGLSMAHGLAAQLGGALAIDSRPGAGTTVALWLPVAAEADGDAGPEDAPARPGEAGLALLVDDEDLARASTAQMLADLGYEVVEAASAEAALALVAGGLRPGLLVTDHLMPGMSGTALALTLRDRLAGLPVLVVSGYAEVEGLEAALPHLPKPFRRADLAARVAALGRA